MNHLLDSTRQTLPTGTVTFLFTDIEGSTRIAQEYPDALPDLIARHNAILQKSIEASHGYVFQIIGDAFCAAFQTTSDALDSALMAQRSLQHEKWGPAPVMVRMGIHTGLARADVKDDHSVGYIGYLTLARTQHIMASAYGEQVLLSDTSASLVQDSLPQDIMLRDLGEHQLKGAQIREHLWQLVADDLRTGFPPLKTRGVIPNNLPLQLTSFIGRERELTHLKELQSNTHLLTLIGPGGTGKSRLTLQLAAEILPEFPDGVWFVELAPLSDPALVLQTIAATLGLRENPGLLLKDQVTQYLKTKRALLILDNCEHLVEACAQLANHLISHCPPLKVVASSREALGIAGETIFRVPPLDLPGSDRNAIDTIRDSEAVQLFVERARALKTDFTLTARNAPAVAQICRRMDGIPLALELAAARVGMLTPEQIAARLDDRFQLLTGGSRTALPRQQTLRSMIDWSYDMLPQGERLLFCQLSVFVGGWSLEAAEALCPELDVLDLLTQLTNKSLVVADESLEQNRTHFRLLETIRQYARDRLLETGTIAQVRDRHLDYYLQLAEAGEIKFSSPLRLEWMDECELDHDNFRAALQWGLDHNLEAALRLGGALGQFWGTRGYNTEGRNWLQAALGQEASLPDLEGEAGRQRMAARAKGLNGFCEVFYGLGDYQAALDASQEAAQLYRQLGDRFGLAYALCNTGSMAAFQSDMALAEQALAEAIRIGHELGSKLLLCFAMGVFSHYIALPRGDTSAARQYAEESARYAREMGMAWAEAQCEVTLARIASILHQWDEARQHALNAVDVFKNLKDSTTLYQAYNELGDIELRAGNIAEARQYLRQGLATGHGINLRAFVAHSLESYTYIARAENQPQRAARLLGAAEAIREGLGTSTIGVDRLDEEYASVVGWLRTTLSEADYDNLWSEGCEMSMEQAITYALEEYMV